MSIYRVTMKASHSVGGAQYNIHHYEFPGYVPTTPELEEFAQGFADIIEENMLGMFAPAVTFQEIELRRVDLGDQPTSDFQPSGWPLAGTGTGSSLPVQVAAVLRWTAPTEFPRSGRTYLPTFTTSSLFSTGGLTGAATIVLDAVAGLLEEIEVTGQVDAQKVAVHYGGDPLAVVASNVLFQRATSSQWGIQRRRRQGVGI